jgi:hypothetical protein
VRDLTIDSLRAHKYSEILGMYFLDVYGTDADRSYSAEIIKVEHPTRGDDTRSWGPPDLAYTDGVERPFPGESAYYLSVWATLPYLEVTTSNSLPGQPQQEVNRPIFQQPRRHSHPAQTRTEMRCSGRELPTWPLYMPPSLVTVRLDPTATEQDMTLW